jgi:hypothetical protein
MIASSTLSSVTIAQGKKFVDGTHDLDVNRAKEYLEIQSTEHCQYVKLSINKLTSIIVNTNELKKAIENVINCYR